MPETREEIKTLEETFRVYAWGYFQLHAEQRLKAFQFFITLATAIVGGSVLLLRYGQGYMWMAVLGFLLSVCTQPEAVEVQVRGERPALMSGSALSGC